MTHKPIFYSAHAELRLRQRRVTRREVRVVLAIGRATVLRHGGTRRDLLLDGRRIAVLYREYRSRLHIWTVMLVPGE